VLGQKLSAETAEAKRIDRSQGDSTMMVIAQNVQDMIDNCLAVIMRSTSAAALRQAAATSTATSLVHALNRRKSNPCCSFTPLAPSRRRLCCVSLPKAMS
jgi:hypothetical protein